MIAGTGEPITTVALGGPVDPSNAPRPSNESERLLFRQLYETLIRLDCDGHAQPGLADSWQRTTDGRSWIVTLREHARFSDGTAVTPADIRASWMLDPAGEELRPHVSRLVESIAPAGDRTLAITLRSAHPDAPLALAHADLAIAKRTGDSRWPLGTHAIRVLPEDPSATDRHGSVAVLARDDQSTIRFVGTGGDPRDWLDNAVDLLLTRDPAVLAYAATLPDFQSVPLAWQHTLALVTPDRPRSAPSLSHEARQNLADDAVRGEARGAREPFWWQMLPDCAATPAPSRAPAPRTPRVVYDASDAAARDVAERLVGLARASDPAVSAWLDALLPDRPSRTFQRATGLTGDALAAARRRGNDAGYVISLGSRPIDPCQALRGLWDATPWLDPEAIVPLVDTRLQAVVRRGRAGLVVEWDGGLRIAGVRDSK